MAWSGRGFFNRPRYQTQEQEHLGFFPCASGCRGSDSDPRTCKCICQGLNHGALLYQREIQPIPVPRGLNPNLPFYQEPEALPDLSNTNRFEKGVEKFERELAKPEKGPSLSGRIGRKVGKSFVKAMTGGKRSETELNEEILNGLKKQFSEERVNAIVDEAFTEHYSHNPNSNTPELYELYESGFIENTLARHNLRWVVGRPKRK